MVRAGFAWSVCCLISQLYLNLQENKKNMPIIGIDAGATWIKAGRFGENLRLEKSVQIASGAGQGVEAYLASIAKAVAQVGRADAVGLALPGTFSRDGMLVRYAANVRGLTLHDSKPLAIATLAQFLEFDKIAAGNDAACAALAEWQVVSDRGESHKSLLQVTWGTGIGTAFVVDGVAQYGWEGGHMPLTWEATSDIPCNCGSQRDLEAWCAVPHLTARSQLAPEALLAAAERGEDQPAQVVADALRWLARGLHMMSVLVYPDIVTIGGGFMASDRLLTQLREQVAKESSGYLVDALRPDMVCRAQLGNEAGMIGAAILAKQRFG
jgi:glucokinase